MTAPVENALIITVAGELYHCTGDLNSLTSIEDLGDKLIGAIVSHNHPIGSDNDYTFSELDRKLFAEYKLEILRGIDEIFIYEFNRNTTFVDDNLSAEDIPYGFASHNRNMATARHFGFGYRRWRR